MVEATGIPQAPSIGLAIIAKNEEAALPGLLESVQGAVDRVVLVDTGSTDSTVEIFEAWAASEIGAGRLGSYLCERFEWVDDFAAARTFAHARLGTEWELWADCDDVIAGAQNMRALVAQAPPELAALIVNYDYATDAHGNVVCRLQRERLVRAGTGKWTGRVHEAQLIEGAAQYVAPDTLNWIHRKDPATVDQGRNLRILKAWEKEEPDNARVVGYLGTEELARGKAKRALKWFKRYLALDPGWDEERAQVHRKLSVCFGELGKEEESVRSAFDAMRLVPTWPDSYLTLAEHHYRVGELGKALHWCDEVLRLGVPQTLLIINPLEYIVQPLVLKAACAAGVGNLPAALELCEQALTLVPDHPCRATYLSWRAVQKRNATADSFIASAQTLVAHDEQAKAFAVLESVPHYAYDHPQVVAWRSMLRERLNELNDADAYAEHYKTGGSQPEDMVPDDAVMDLGDALPRCGFLLEGLRAQAAPA